MTELKDLFNDAKRGANAISAEVNTYISQIQKFDKNIISHISTPVDMASAIKSLFTRADLLFTEADERLNYIKQMFNFGDDFTAIKPTTSQRLERKKNRDVIVAQTQGTSLSQSYADAVLIEYDTVEDLDESADRLEVQFEKFIQLDELDSTSFDNFTQMRARFRNFIDEERLTAPKVGIVEVNSQPVTKLAYSLYGNLDNVEKLISLNNLKDASVINGSVKVLTA